MYFSRRCLIDEIWGHCDGVGICGQDSVLSWIKKWIVFLLAWIWE